MPVREKRNPALWFGSSAARRREPSGQVRGRNAHGQNLVGAGVQEVGPSFHWCANPGFVDSAGVRRVHLPLGCCIQSRRWCVGVTLMLHVFEVRRDVEASTAKSALAVESRHGRVHKPTEWPWMSLPDAEEASE